MEFRVDILDDRLEALEAVNDRERFRRYFELWRAGVVDPLNDPGVVVIVLPGDGPLVVNDGEGPDPAEARAGLAAASLS
jgi:hypothetical protein